MDDEEHALHILELFLGRIGGVEVVGRCQNGFDAIERLRTMKPDVLFLDIEMPEMNGIELAEIVRNDHADLPIVFVTAYDQYAIAAFEREAIDYILKPLEMDRLSKTVARLRRESAKPGVSEERQAAAAGQRRMKISVLGPFVARIEDGPRIKWRTAKEKELLAYLAVHGDSRMHRDMIIEELWPDEAYPKAKVYLHTCISLVRKAFKQLGFDGILKYENERYFLDSDRVDIDVQLFKSKLNKLKQSGGASPDEIEKALALYQGHMLKDEDYIWAEQEAEQLDKSAAQWRLQLAESYIETGHYAKASETAERAIECSPYDEEAYRLLMRSFQKMGKNEEVLRVYRSLAERLKELRIEPSEVTRTMYEHIQTKRARA